MSERIFHRTELLIGQEAMRMLRDSCMVVIGLGGVGSYAAEAIARSGVGRIILCDPDRVEASNINRQLAALNSTLGELKTEVIGARLRDINPLLQLSKYPNRYCEESSTEILGQEIHFVLDAIDTLPDKIHLIKTCLYRKIPVISSMGTANRLAPLRLTIADIKGSSICPVARKLRRGLRRENILQGVPVVYSRETPVKTTYSGETRLGSISFVPAAAGLLLASYAVKQLIKNTNPPCPHP
ncbi:MAG: tRNA threonylcarbamoyladenosine dehydratase [Syntrophomonas sp.]|nr:tRNA threonylcarbamoyladenosine dehydratase [Syntrophomonas sp.]